MGIKDKLKQPIKLGSSSVKGNEDTEKKNKPQKSTIHIKPAKPAGGGGGG
jgi:hypothetical protein